MTTYAFSPAALDPRVGIAKKQPFTKLEVNWAHPLARGLYVAFVGSQRIDLAGKRHLQFRNGAAITSAKRNKAVSLDGADDVIEVLGAVEDYDASGAMSIVAAGTNTNGNGTIVARRDGSVADWQFYIDGAPNRLSWRTGSALFGGNTDVGASARTFGVSHASGDSEVFLDGVSDGTSAAITSSGSISGPVSIGARWNTYPTTGFEFGGTIEYAFVWYGRKLTADEQLSIARDPYQIFRPVVRPFALLTLGEPTVSLNLVAATDSVEEPELTLTVALNLVAATDTVEQPTLVDGVALELVSDTTVVYAPNVYPFQGTQVLMVPQFRMF